MICRNGVPLIIESKLIINNTKLTQTFKEFPSLLLDQEGEKVDVPNDDSMAFTIEISSLGRTFK